MKIFSWTATRGHCVAVSSWLLVGLHANGTGDEDVDCDSASQPHEVEHKNGACQIDCGKKVESGQKCLEKRDKYLAPGADIGHRFHRMGAEVYWTAPKSQVFIAAERQDRSVMRWDDPGL